MTQAHMVSSEDWQALDDPRQHLAALTRLSSERLASGDARAAFMFADRRCRLGMPFAHDLLLRSEALRRLGFAASAEADLARAAALDPTDPAVNHRLIEAKDDRSGPAARWVVSDPRSGRQLQEAAAALLFAEGMRLVGSLTVEGNRLLGWVSSRGRSVLTLRIDVRSGRYEVPVQPQAGDGRPRFVRIAITLADAFAQASVLADGRPCEDVFLDLRINPTARDVPPRQAPAEAAPAASEGAVPRLVNVVVPIYDDVEITGRCLEALAGQNREGLSLRVILVDDAAPAPGMKALLDEACARHGFERIVNPRNLGFIGSVNEALSRLTEGDVVLLNADVLLPPAALGKLAAAAYAAPGVGIVNPLTNNGQFTSFPATMADNSFGDGPLIEAIDRIAGEVAPDTLTETPGGIGYCMYVTRACLDAVGPMPEVYLRGYYEDIEFCLRAAERGFATVCAPGIYVGHKGTASFKSEKKRLVERNKRAIEARFPSYRGGLEAFLRADPLRVPRAAIEARAAPLGAADVLLAGSALYAPLLEARAQALEAQGRSTVLLTWAVCNGAMGARFRHPGAAEPRQRVYAFDSPEDRRDLEADILALTAFRVEVAGSPAGFAPVLRAVLRHGPEYGVLLCESLGRSPPVDHGCLLIDEPEPCPTCFERFNVHWQPHGIGRDLQQAWGQEGGAPDLFVAMDAMAQEVATDLSSDAFRASRFERCAPAPPVRPLSRAIVRPVLALPYAEPDGETERLLAVLAATLLRTGSGWHLVLLGAGLDDRRLMSSGNLFVTGPVRDEDCAEALVHYGAACLFSPHRWSGFGHLARLAEALALPKAYFDWSIGALPAQDQDLSIDPRVCDAKAAYAVAGWLDGQAIGSAS